MKLPFVWAWEELLVSVPVQISTFLLSQSLWSWTFIVAGTSSIRGRRSLRGAEGHGKEGVWTSSSGKGEQSKHPAA